MLCTIAGVTVTGSLGLWQLRRAAQKQAIQAEVQAQALAEPLRNLQVARPDAPLHRRAIVRGTWLPEHTVFLDNRQMQGKVGFYVVTPLKLENSPAVLLVQRGWAPRNFLSREALPQVETPAGVVEVSGRMAPLPGKLYELGNLQSGAIRQNLDLGAYKAETGLPALAISLQQAGLASEGLLRDWPAINYGVEKHYGYAFQWFGIGSVMIVLFGWVQFVGPALQRRKKLQSHE